MSTQTLTRRRLMRNAGFAALTMGILMLGVGGWLDLRLLLLIGIATAGVGVIWLICWPFTADDPIRPEGHRFIREFFPAITAYVILVLLAGSLLGKVDTPALKWLLALAPAVPIIWIVRAMLRQLLASDELEQRIQLQAIAIAAASVGLASFVAGFLAIAGLIPGTALLLWVLPMLFAVYGLANWRIRRRYAGS